MHYYASLAIGFVPFLFIAVAFTVNFLVFKDSRTSPDEEHRAAGNWILLVRYASFFFIALMCQLLVVCLEDESRKSLFAGPFPSCAACIVILALGAWIYNERDWQRRVAFIQAPKSPNVQPSYFSSKFLAAFCLLPIAARLLVYGLFGL